MVSKGHSKFLPLLRPFKQEGSAIDLQCTMYCDLIISFLAIKTHRPAGFVIAARNLPIA